MLPAGSGTPRDAGSRRSAPARPAWPRWPPPERKCQSFAAVRQAGSNRFTSFSVKGASYRTEFRASSYTPISRSAVSASRTRTRAPAPPATASPPLRLAQQFGQHLRPGRRVVPVHEDAGDPSRTAVRRPPTAAATTGVPHAWASSATRPNDSECTAPEPDQRPGTSRPARAAGTAARAARRPRCPARRASSARLSGLPTRCRSGRPRGPPPAGRPARIVAAAARPPPAAGRPGPSAAGCGRRRPAPPRPAAARACAPAPPAAEPGRNTKVDPGATVRSAAGRRRRARSAGAASSAVLATSRSAAATTSSSPRIRAAARRSRRRPGRAFFTLPRVCMDCTSGTPQRSAATAPTCPESQ